MADQTGLEFLIKAILDSKGFDDFKAKMQESNESAAAGAEKNRDLTASSKDFGDALDEAGKKLAAGAAEIGIFTEALGFLKDSLKEAIEASKQLAQFNAAIDETSGKTKKSKEENEAWLKSVELASGATKSELVPAYMKLAEVTGSAAQGQALLQIAAGASARGLGDLGTNATLLGRYLADPSGPIRGTTALGLAMKAMKAEGLSQEEIMKRLAVRFSDAGASVNTAAMQVQRAKVQWSEFKEGVGNLAISLVSLLQPALKIAAMAIAAVVMGAQQLGGYLGVLAGSTIPALFSALKKGITGDFAGAKAALLQGFKDTKSGFSEVNEAATKTGEKLLEAFNLGTSALKGTKEVTDLARQATKRLADAGESVTDMYKRLALEAQNSAQSQIAAALAVAAVWKKASTDNRLNALQQAEAERKVQEAVKAVGDELSRQDKEWQKGADDRVKKLAAADKKELDDYRKAVDNELKLSQQHYQKLAKIDKAYGLELAAEYDAEAQNFQISEDKRNAYAEKAAEIRKAINVEEMKSQQAAMDASVSFASDAFGATKGIAIAQAIVATYQGAARALADYQYPYSIIVAALAIASGLAQVAKIESTEPASTSTSKKGFDDPRNDFASYLGGQKWARDMVDHFAHGAAAGFSQGVMNQSNSSTVINNNNAKSNANYNIRLAGLVDSGDDAMMRRFVRKFQAFDFLEKQRTNR